MAAPGKNVNIRRHPEGAYHEENSHGGPSFFTVDCSAGAGSKVKVPGREFPGDAGNGADRLGQEDECCELVERVGSAARGHRRVSLGGVRHWLSTSPRPLLLTGQSGARVPGPARAS